MCGSPTELLVVLLVVVIILLVNAATRTRAKPRVAPKDEEDDGIRVRFLPDDDERDGGA